MVSFGFFGSSNLDFAKKYDHLVERVLTKIFDQHSEVRIITGGYDGFMSTICQRAKELAAVNPNKIYVETYGILYNEYDEEPNPFLDRTITTNDLGERVNSLIEMSDFLFGFPGSNGTLHEILQTNENLKYPSRQFSRLWCKQLYIHAFWENQLDFKLEREKVGGVLFFDDEDELDFSFEPSIFQEDYSTQKLSFHNDIIGQINDVIFGRTNHEKVILGFDFAFTAFNTEFGINIGENHSISTKSYQRILRSFLEENPSLLSFDQQIQDYKHLKSCFVNSNEDLINLKMPIQTTKIEDSIDPEKAFSIWNDHLEKHKYGKLSFWNSEPLEFNDISVNVSCFLVLDIDLTKWKSERISSLLSHYILSSGFKILLGQIQRYLITTQELNTFKDYATSHKHVIKNLPFRYGLERLEGYIVDDPEARELLASISSTVDLRDIATQLFYSFDNQNAKDAFEVYGVKTITLLLELIHRSGFRAFKHLEDFQIEDSCLDHSKNQIVEENFLDVFNVVFNLYSNTRKHCKDKGYKVSLFIDPLNQLTLSYETQTILPKTYVEFLNGNCNVKIDQHKGFKHIEDSIKKLRGLKTNAKVDESIPSSIINILFT